MRKRTFMDRKFSAGDANSQQYRDSWDRMFGDDKSETPTPDNGVDETESRQREKSGAGS